MSISFSQVPAAWREPGWMCEIDNSMANSGAGSAKKTILIGQRLATGTLAEKVVSEVITSDAQAAGLFGIGSMLHRMVVAFRAENQTSELYAIAVDDLVAGTRSTGSITMLGAATANGTLALYIGGTKVSVGVTVTDTAAAQATAIKAAVNTYSAEKTSGTMTIGHWYEITKQSVLNFVTDGAANSLVGTLFIATGNALTLTAADAVKEVSSNHAVFASIVVAAPTVVNFVAKQKGTNGNGVDIRFNYLGALADEAMPAGTTATIVAMHGATGDPDNVDDALAVLSTQYFAIVQPYDDATSLNAVAAFMEDQWDPLVQNYGHSFTASINTVGNLTTLGNSRNDAGVTIFGMNATPTPVEEMAASMAGAAIASLEIDPARPLHTLAADHVLAPVATSRFTKLENNTLLYDGISPPNYASDSGVQLGRVITTYTTNSVGEADDSYLDVMTRYTLQAIVEYMKARIMSKYPRVKLVADGTPIPAGQAAVTPSTVGGELISAYKSLMDLVIVQNLSGFVDGLICEINALDPKRLDVVITPYLAGQLNVIAVKNQFHLIVG